MLVLYCTAHLRCTFFALLKTDGEFHDWAVPFFLQANADVDTRDMKHRDRQKAEKMKGTGTLLKAAGALRLPRQVQQQFDFFLFFLFHFFFFFFFFFISFHFFFFLFFSFFFPFFFY